ncbi:hypothetical protein RB595_005519 [Gaeumannomyces hyphopodioides]
MASKKILIVLTSRDKMEADNVVKPTGWFLPEFSHPHDVLVKAGYEITVASPAGGKAPLDPASIEMFKEDASAQAFLKNQTSLWEQTAKLSDVAPGAAQKFDALFYPGGHGPMFDLAVDATSQSLIADFWAAGKPVAAVCHGPVAFVGVKLPDGTPLLKGRTATGFTNAEEEIMQLVKFMPELLEDDMKKAGANFVKADEPWGEKVVVDGNLITGQNPASAKAVGEAIVKLLA